MRMEGGMLSRPPSALDRGSGGRVVYSPNAPVGEERAGFFALGERAQHGRGAGSAASSTMGHLPGSAAMSLVIPTLPKPPVSRIAAWLLMLLGMWLALKLGLVVTLLSGLLVFHLTHLLASTVEGKLPPGRARAYSVIVLSALIIGVLTLAAIGIASFFRTETGGPDALLMRLMDILNSSRHQVPALLQPYIPEDLQALRTAVNDWAATHRQQLGIAGTSVVQISVRVLIGMVLGAMIALYDELPLPKMGPLAQELIGRTSRLATAFRQVVFAQVKISLLNTLFTAIFLLVVLPLFGVHVPLSKTLVLITFLAGLLPVVGNIISNTVITIVALSVSFYVAMAALLYLVVIHKLEYFLNARIVGGEIQARAWELLLAMLVMEAAFGLPGLVAAPVFYAYIKRELLDQRWI
jgi:predicted PurR-regulated permease PerM